VTAVRRIGIPAAVLSGLLALVAIFQPIPFDLAFRAWLVAVGGLVAAELLRVALRPYRRLEVEPVRLGRRRPAPQQRAAGLEEIERAVDFAVWNAADLRRRLRPLLREIAAHRLRSRRGVDLERNPEAAERVLGPVTWSLLSGDSEPADRRGPGARPDQLREAVDRLEAL
jgi:hypothetical protein